MAYRAKKVSKVLSDQQSKNRYDIEDRNAEKEMFIIVTW